MAMNAYAQTNIQLLNQLRAEGYATPELARIRDVYKLTTRLFTGGYQPCGKPFIDHLVGTASILACLHRPVEVVAAGLVHAAYIYGDFGSIRRGRSDAKRQKVRQAVGKEVEEYVARYTALRWTGQTIPAVRDRIESLGPIDREVLLMRLANTLELHLDLGTLWCGNAEGQQEVVKRDGALVIGIADKLDFPVLATELARVFAETATGVMPRELRNRSNQTRTYFIAPKSYRKRLPLAVWRQLRQLSWVQMGVQKALKVTGIQFYR
jgi:(p)ppGpp synthase/HD superfamily hydrolase